MLPDGTLFKQNTQNNVSLHKVSQILHLIFIPVSLVDLKNKAATILFKAPTSHATETKGKRSRQHGVISDVTLDKHINWISLSEEQCSDKYNYIPRVPRIL